MISASLTNAKRRAVYKRDGWRCALCDSTDGIQIHHITPRGKGGSDDMGNLICLCWRCHGEVHGVPVRDPSCMAQEEIEQAIAEYMGDLYADNGKVWVQE